MANNPEIQVEIGAITDKLKKGVDGAILSLSQLEKEAQTLNKALETATDPADIVRLNQSLAQTKQAMVNLRSAGIEPLTRAQSNYNSVGIDFARIIQDAPFGIIGVGNNITQLATSFSTLQANSKSTGQAIKTAFASIFSSGNALVLGISLLTTAFTVLQQKGFFKTGEAAKSLDDQLKEYQETLKGVASASLKGAQDAQKEIASLTALQLQVENTNLSQKDRLAAVNELQDQYPSYFGNLTKEQILNGQVGDAYKLVTESLLAKAKAQASINKIAENSIKLLTVETKLEELKSKRLLETASAQGQLDSLIAKRQRDGFLTQQDIARYDELLRRLNEANKSQGEEVTLLTEKLSILNENESLEGLINQQLEKGVSLVSRSVEENKKLLDEVDKIKRVYEDISKLPSAPSLGMPSSLPSAPTKGISGRPTPEGETLTQFLNRISQDFDAFGGNFLNSVEIFTANVNGIIRGNLENAFLGVGEAIGQAFATGENVFSALGQSLLSSISNFLGDLGQQLIAFGVAGIAFGSLMEAIKKGGPLSIPAGIGAIAAGTALVAISSAIRSRASKGISGGGSGSVGTSGVGSGTSFSGAGATAGSFNRDLALTGEFMIRGTDLVYVIDRSKERIGKG